MESARKFLVLLALAGSLFLLFGCGEDGEQPPAPVPVQVADNGTGEAEIGVEENETECLDGTPFGNCSVNQPKFCDESGNLLDDVEACGCPEDTFRRGSECLERCGDGTALGECSAEQPYYCNMSAELEEAASLCGCAAGYDRDGESCRNSCDDGTPKLVCSEATPPYYCSDEYELVINPVLCGCFEWEFRVGGSCFDPTAREYESGEAVRLTSDVTMVIDRVEEMKCDDASYIGLRLTISNTGDGAFPLSENEFRMFKDEYRMFADRPQGCGAANVYNWADVKAGATKVGNLYFKIVGGVGDVYTAQVSKVYYGSMMRHFNVTLEIES